MNGVYYWYIGILVYGMNGGTSSEHKASCGD